ncbi:hypothetical protein N7E81_07115 [Reichenbachiella carrageenanivorans]|uniref:Uncharacterized protein n=1 Tax=Reichenbachiella carrageenanivorans TaxID=2979869 RepID=A0ABY6D6W5_9BACT|nr:hypothetical protein [Reichenbachiella carrageenanivorans]UXX80868.1 hypothetical protein N7E81_07115 [Reichenbachiella carrageenanivorans]
MKRLKTRYSKMLLIILGVLVAILIGLQSSAVGFDSEWEPDTESAQGTPTNQRPEKLHFKLLSLLK